ncbi:MAG: DUF1003 domain-containing protein [Stellaceae bacterium]
MRPLKSWHRAHLDNSSAGARIADHVAGFIGSWRFIIIQSVIFAIWVVVNTLWLFSAYQFDPYPFILFNLFMSAEAAYSSPLILMSQNRQAERDRTQAENDYQTNVAAKEEIEAILRELGRIEVEKLDRILALLKEPASIEGES